MTDRRDGARHRHRIRRNCKTNLQETAAPPPNSGKNHYLKRLNHASRSAPCNTSRATTKGRHGRVSHDAGESVILLSYPATELSEESELRY